MTEPGRQTPPAQESEVLDSVLAGVPLPLVLVAADERVRAINRSAETLFGPGMKGRHYFTVLRQPSVIDAISDAFRTRTAHETRMSLKDHTQETLYRVLCSPVVTGVGPGVIVTFDDVTSVEKASQMRRDFVANVSHELRTPLTAIAGFIETLRGPARDDPDARERFLATMEGEAERMNRLINDLLSLSRVETEERVRPTELQDLGELVRSVCLGLRPVTEEAGLELNVGPSEGVPMVLGDEDQLRQVFANIITNASKYAADGGRLDVGFEVVGRDPILGQKAVAVHLRDHGSGIDSIHLHRLTERFYRADSHRSRSLGGTGLGLAIVKHILNRHRGRLKIESELGAGACFSVILPCPRG
jgi:two-component system phosphate regulon sensor histidine kinase PhoR